MKDLTFTDCDGDELSVEAPMGASSPDVVAFFQSAKGGTYVTRAQAVKIITFLAKRIAENPA